MPNISFKIKDIFADHWDAFLDQGYLVRPAVLKVVFVILVVLNIFRMVLLQFLLNSLIANIVILFLLFLKNLEFSFAEIEIYSMDRLQ